MFPGEALASSAWQTGKKHKLTAFIWQLCWTIPTQTLVLIEYLSLLSKRVTKLLLKMQLAKTSRLWGCPEPGRAASFQRLLLVSLACCWLCLVVWILWNNLSLGFDLVDTGGIILINVLKFPSLVLCPIGFTWLQHRSSLSRNNCILGQVALVLYPKLEPSFESWNND